MGKNTLVFSDDMYDAQLGRTMFKVAALSADLGEALATARQIGKADPDRWYDGWTARADSIRDGIDDLTPASRPGAWLRAAEYYRQAFFFLRHRLDDPRLRQAYRSHVESFSAALPLLDQPIEPVVIAFEGSELRGYFYRSGEPGERRPTVLLPCGYDSTAEESHSYAVAAVRQGFSALTFEGPGQGGALIEQGLLLRPEFEQVLSPWVDAVLARDDVEPAALVLIGRSFAGYLAPRAAAFEHRLAALVCDPAQPDMAAHLPEGLVGRVAAPISEVQIKLDPNRAEFFGARMAAHGVSTVEEYFAELRKFTMLEVAGQISCPVLAVECEGDFAGGGGTTLAAALRSPAQVLNLTSAEGVGGHCGGVGQLAWEDRVYPWIRDTLAT